jgi:hypothetical protein
MLCVDASKFSDVSLGAPLLGFMYATRLGFTSVLVEYKLEFPFFISKSSCRVLMLVHLHDGPNLVTRFIPGNAHVEGLSI